VPDIQSLNIAQYVSFCCHSISLLAAICRATIKLLLDHGCSSKGCGRAEVVDGKKRMAVPFRTPYIIDEIQLEHLTSAIHAAIRQLSD